MVDIGMTDFFSSGIFDFILFMFIGTIVLALIGWGIWIWFKKKFVYVFRFHMIQVNGRIERKWARIKLNNNRIKKFQIQGHKTQLLDLHEPNAIVNGKPSRLVTWDGQGNIVYCKKVDYDNLNENDRFKVSKIEYLQTALEPVERDSVVMNMIDAYSKYGTIPSEFKWFMGASIIMLVIIILGLLGMAKILGGQVENFVENSDASIQASDNILNAVKIIEQNNKIQLAILNIVTKDNRSLNFTAS